jgi:predicted Rossmann fold flavoprotein
MDILQSIARLGHTLEPVLPALAPITTAPKPIQKLQGVRMDLTLSLFDSKARLGRTTGNAIFTQWGLNGPAAMNLSHLVQTSGSHDYWLSIDFLPGQSKQLRDLLREYQESEIPLLVLLKSILPPKVARLMVDKCDIPVAAPVRSISRVEIEKCFELMTSFRLPVTGVRGFEYAQLSTGGVAVSEVDSHSMMSRKVRGLYFAGEILNVHGPCGGFNLQWAFSSGMVAGKAMAALTR